MTLLWIFIPLGSYLLGLVFTFARVASHRAWQEMRKYSYRQNPNWGEGIFVGLVNALVWPISLPIWLCYWHVQSGRTGVAGSWLFRPPPHLREIAHDHSSREREDYIKRLEQKAGIR